MLTVVFPVAAQVVPAATRVSAVGKRNPRPAVLGLPKHYFVPHQARVGRRTGRPSALLVAVGSPARAHAVRSYRGFVVGAMGVTTGGSGSAVGTGEKVLVVGATGRIGRMVVDTLSSRGVEVVAMVRDPSTDAARSLEKLPGAANVTLAQGDLNDSAEALGRLLSGCSTCISCSGASRLTTLSDVLGNTLDDPRHPYNVNYKGIQRLCDAMRVQGCKRLVRVTVNALGKSAFFPFTVLLNAVLSMTTKWQFYGENAIRASGIEYTIIRPPKLVDQDRPADVHLRLTHRGESGPGLISISRGDVASLICKVYNNPVAANATLTCKWGKGPEGAQEWGALVQDVIPDKTNEEISFPPKPFTLAVGIYSAVLALLLAIAAKAVLALFTSA